MRFAPFMQYRRVRQALTLFLIAGALACMFPPQNKLFQWWAAHSSWVSLAYLAMGMVLLVLSRTRLMFVCLGCSAAVSFFANEMALRRLEPSAEAQPVFKFACLYNPGAQAQEIAGILLERGIDAVLLAGKPGQTDSTLLVTLLRHWPNCFNAPANSGDTLHLCLYTRLPVADGNDTMRIDSSGGIWISLRPEFARENMWVYIAGEVRSSMSEVQSLESEVDSLKSDVDSSESEVAPAQVNLRTSDFGFRTTIPPGPIVALGHQYSSALLFRAGAAGWHDSYLCQKTDEKGVKYPFNFRIYHTSDIDCVHSEMLRLANREYLGLESILRLSHGPEKPH